MWRLLAPAAVLGLGLVAIGAGNGAPAGGGTSLTRFVVFERPSGPVGYVLVDEHGHTIARSDLMPEISVAGAVVTAVQRGRSYRIELRPGPDAPSRVVVQDAGPTVPEPALSADGKALAVATGRHILIVSVPAGTHRTLALGPGSYSAPAFSPDGSLLAFVRSTGNGRAGTYRADLQVVPIAGGPAVTVFRVPHPLSSQPQPVFTPDGKRLAFVVDDTELVTAPVAGGALVPVAPKLRKAVIQRVIPLPDGSGYIAVRKPQYGVSDVWQVDDKGVWKRLTVTPIPPRGRARAHAGTYAVALAPDGGQLLVESGTSLETYSFRDRRLTTIGTLPLGAQRGPWPATAAPADGVSAFPAMSADGRSVAFVSAASNLVSGDDNRLDDVFVRDLVSRSTEPVSVAGAAEVAPAISADGRYVAFTSRGAFIRDRVSGTARLQADDDSFAAAISPDGGSVALGSPSALVPEDANGTWDVYVHDDRAGATLPVDVGADGRPVGGRRVYTRAAISDQGRFAAFVSESGNLVPGDTNGVADVFVFDRSLGTIERVSVASGGGQSNGDSGLYAPAITPDGRYVSFASLASNLVPGDTNGTWDVFVRDRLRGTTERVSVGAGGGQANGSSSGVPSLSADGRFVAFQSVASNLVPGDTNGAADVFVRDRATGTTGRVSVAAGGGQGDGQSGDASISADGQLVAFDSQAANLVPGDTNAATDVFVHDRRTGTTTLVSAGWRW